MSGQRKKNIVRETFDIVSSGYDNPALRFFSNSAGFLAENLGLRGDEHVLDVACGTGNATFAIARLLPRGHVTGVDFATGMLEQARDKAASGKISNVEFVEGDMQTLDGGKPYDAAVCSFGIFFVEEMDGLLARIAATVKPGGTVAITGFHESLFGQLVGLFFDQLDAFGIQRPQLDWMRIATVEKSRSFFERVGLGDIRVIQQNMGYYLDDEEGWWDVIWNAGFRRVLGSLNPGQLTKFRQAHLEDVKALRTQDGLWLDVEVLFTFGRKVGE